MDMATITAVREGGNGKNQIMASLLSKPISVKEEFLSSSHFDEMTQKALLVELTDNKLRRAFASNFNNEPEIIRKLARLDENAEVRHAASVVLIKRDLPLMDKSIPIRGSSQMH